MKTKEEILSALQGLKGELKVRYKVEGIALFGSFLRGGQHERSDIDVMVEFGEDADLFDLVGVSLYLEEKLGRKVDVVTKGALREELKTSVLKEASFV